MLKEILSNIVKSQSKDIISKETGIKREKLKEIDLKLNYAIIISGIRRCGKSTLLRQVIDNVKIPSYFNFEDPRATNFKLSDFEKLEEIFQDGEVYFFDEIQNVAEWEKYVRNLVDRKKLVIITGSNASLLSRELGTKLTGRHITYELFPFSYNETLKLKSKKPNLESLKTYLKEGGFPEYLKNKKTEMLQELLNDILARDIIVRNKIKDDKVIKELVIYLLSNIGKEFSYNKITKYLNMGSINTTISYISYLEDSYILFTIPVIDYSYKKQLISPKKVYCVDLGLLNATTNLINENKGMQLENAIFIHLRMKYKEIYYHKKEKECDFIVKEKNTPYLAIQVCYKLNEENKDREISGLKEAMDYLKIKKGIIITLNQKDKIDDIEVIPAWEWLSNY